MSASHHRHLTGNASCEKAPQQRSAISAKPYKFGIQLNRPKTHSMADKALQIEANRAKRFVGEVNQNDLKMPLPRTPAVLAYLRWLDKMDAWYKKSSSIQETSARLRDTEVLYSWNSKIGAPLVLPKIRKHPNPEKYRSKQVERAMMDPELLESKVGDSHPDYAGAVRQKQAIRQLKATYHSSKGHESTGSIRGKQHSARVGDRSGDDSAGKHTKFYIHAMNGFKYWPIEKYNPPVHHTKYSFGTQFNAGRAGVITDRIYTRSRANKHYWTDFQLRQNPIGSGNGVTGRVLSN